MPGAGRLSVSGSGLRRVRRTVSVGGTSKVKTSSTGSEILSSLSTSSAVAFITFARVLDDVGGLYRLEAGTGKRGTDQLQRGGKGGDIGGTYRIAVHGRGIEGRLSEARRKIFCQHAAARITKRRPLGLKRRQPACHPSQSLSDGQESHQRLK